MSNTIPHRSELAKYIVRPPPPMHQPQVVNMVQNRANVYTHCPTCGQNPTMIDHLNWLTCPAFHIFYACPICKDTRVSDKRENIIYCGLLHPYHICAVHNRPVAGTARMTSTCTCTAAMLQAKKKKATPALPPQPPPLGQSYSLFFTQPTPSLQIRNSAHQSSFVGNPNQKLANDFMMPFM
jgi:hypothetical protein